MVSCACAGHDPRFIVLTGGPGAGKTAVLEVIRREFCEHVAVLPEAASILFKGGFPRKPTTEGRRAAQLAIVHVQRELEKLVVAEQHAGIALCDRGTIDGLAYWPGSREEFWREVGSTHEQELARYSLVIHLRTPTPGNGYDKSNPVRIESAKEAAAIDAKIFEAWSEHPRRVVVEATPDFMTKISRVLEIVRSSIPQCCGARKAATLAAR